MTKDKTLDYSDMSERDAEISASRRDVGKKQDEISAEFSAVGFEVSIDVMGRPCFRVRDIPRLLAALRRGM